VSSPSAEQTQAEDGKDIATIRRELGLAKRAYGLGDHFKALEHFRAAAEAGDASAQYYTGVMYADGQGTVRDYAEAAKWYEKAAAQNHPDALFALARLYVFGLGVAPDAHRAVQLYEQAAEAYPPGEDRQRAEEQRLALLEVMKQEQASKESASGQNGI